MDHPKLERDALEHASLDDLLDGLHPVPVKQPSALAIWLEQEGYFPGTSRIQAAELYARYVAWRASHPEIDGPVEQLRVWGKAMSSRFRTTRGKSGMLYWISRQREV